MTVINESRSHPIPAQQLDRPGQAVGLESRPRQSQAHEGAGQNTEGSGHNSAGSQQNTEGSRQNTEESSFPMKERADSGGDEFGEFESDRNRSGQADRAAQRPAFLELCVNTGEFTISLGEINITDVKGDIELFAKIRRRYRELRGTGWRRMLLKPVDVHFVRVSINFSSQSSITCSYNS